MEKEKCHGDIANVTLCRSLLLLSTAVHHKDASDRLLTIDALVLAAACMDVQVEDTHTGRHSHFQL